MSIQPPTLLEVRSIMQRYTGLPAVSLGIIHYVNSSGRYTGGGGYHAGNDLLAMIGKLNTDYSKRESDRDRPGSDYGSAIDIGRFRVTLPNGRVVHNYDMTRWILDEIAAGAPDTHWIREIIYTLDGRTVRRYDRLGIRSSGDDSHLTHEHYSSFRDDVLSPHIPALFRRFWATMEGKIAPAPPVAPTTAKDEEDMYLIEANSNDAQGKPQKVVVLVGSNGTLIGPVLYSSLKGKQDTLNLWSRLAGNTSDNVTAAVWNDTMEALGVEGWRYDENFILQVPST